MKNNVNRRHIESEEEVDEHGSWAVSYGDMITLLLSFFVIYFTTDFGAVSEQQLQDSLMDQMKKMNIESIEEKIKGNEDITLKMKRGVLEKGLDDEKIFMGPSHLTKEGKGPEDETKNGLGPTSELLQGKGPDKEIVLNQSDEQQEALEKTLKAMGLIKGQDEHMSINIGSQDGKNLSVGASAVIPFEETKINIKAQDLDLFKEYNARFHKMGKTIMVDFPGTSFYDLGKVEVRAPVHEKLNRFAKYYLPYAGKYILDIRAFTDSNPVIVNKYRYNDNLELSALRSLAAMRVLQYSGIPLNRMELAGHGVNKMINKQLTKMFSGKEVDKKELDALARTIVLIIRPDTSEEELGE